MGRLLVRLIRSGHCLLPTIRGYRTKTRASHVLRTIQGDNKDIDRPTFHTADVKSMPETILMSYIKGVGKKNENEFARLRSASKREVLKVTEAAPFSCSIFTDGSVKADTSGVGGIGCWCAVHNWEWREKLEACYSSTEAELVGILRALQHAREWQDARLVSIFSDSKSAIDSISALSAKSPEYTPVEDRLQELEENTFEKVVLQLCCRTRKRESG